MNGNGVLIFGEQQTGQRPLCRTLYRGEEAYSRYQLSAYMDEIIQISSERNFVESRNLFQQLALLAKWVNAEYLVEIGSTLFASIDKYLKCQMLYPNLPDVEFIGIEPNRLLSDTASLLHQHITSIRQLTDHSEYECQGRAIGRSYQSTSYAFESTEELVEWISQFEVSQDGIWFSAGDSDKKTENFGSKLTLFSFQKFQTLMLQKGFYVNILTAQRVNHRYEKIIETFVLSHRVKDVEEFNQQLSDQQHSILNEHHTSIDNARLSYPERTIPQQRGGMFESILLHGELDFTSKINLR